MPPLTQSVASPRRTLRLNISCSNVTVMRVPVQPIGWPRAIAPPLTLEDSHGRNQFAIASQDLRSESFVKFNQVEIGKL